MTVLMIIAIILALSPLLVGNGYLRSQNIRRSPWDHDRRDGYLSAYRELHRRVREDLDAERGDIKPPRIKFARYDPTIVLMKARILQWIESA